MKYRCRAAAAAVVIVAPHAREESIPTGRERVARIDLERDSSVRGNTLDNYHTYTHTCPVSLLPPALSKIRARLAEYARRDFGRQSSRGESTCRWL